MYFVLGFRLVRPQKERKWRAIPTPIPINFPPETIPFPNQIQKRRFTCIWGRISFRDWKLSLFRLKFYVTVIVSLPKSAIRVKNVFIYCLFFFSDSWNGSPRWSFKEDNSWQMLWTWVRVWPKENTNRRSRPFLTHSVTNRVSKPERRKKKRTEKKTGGNFWWVFGNFCK